MRKLVTLQANSWQSGSKYLLDIFFDGKSQVQVVRRWDALVHLVFQLHRSRSRLRLAIVDLADGGQPDPDLGSSAEGTGILLRRGDAQQPHLDRPDYLQLIFDERPAALLSKLSPALRHADTQLGVFINDEVPSAKAT